MSRGGAAVLVMIAFMGFQAHADDPKDPPKKGAVLTFGEDEEPQGPIHCDDCKKAESGLCTKCAKKVDSQRLFFVPLKGLKTADDEAAVEKALGGVEGIQAFSASRKLKGAVFSVTAGKHVLLSAIEKALGAKFETDRKARLIGSVRLVVEGANEVQPAIAVLEALGFEVDKKSPKIDQAVKQLVAMDQEKKTGSFNVSWRTAEARKGSATNTLDALAATVAKTKCKLADVGFDGPNVLSFGK
jgi:hypothetical protein